MSERTPTPRRVPQLVVVLKIEAAPFVRIEADTDADYERLADWIRARPELHQLVTDAVALRDEGRVA